VRLWYFALALLAMAPSVRASAPMVTGPKAQEVLALIQMVDRGERELVEAELKGVRFISHVSLRQKYKRLANAGDIPASKSLTCELVRITGTDSSNKRSVRVAAEWKCGCCDIYPPNRYFEFRGGRLRVIKSIDIAGMF
jgi:hypothetical protein